VVRAAAVLAPATEELLLELGVPVVLDVVVGPPWQLRGYD
jgi:predicted kinase